MIKMMFSKIGEELLVVLTVVLIISAITGVYHKTDQVVEAAETSGINWHDYEEGLERAKQTDKPVFIHFGASWCGVLSAKNFVKI